MYPRKLLQSIIHNRLLSTSSPRFSKPFTPSPSPPRLDSTQQSIFETLQRQSQGAFSSQESQPASPEEKGPDDGLHPNIRRGAPPEFKGETNPKTGEVGGPKNEPLRWGGEGDWSYNGRVTDF